MQSRKPDLWAAEFVTFPAATVFLILRVISRRITRVGFWYDDYFAMLFYATAVAWAVMLPQWINHGFGLHSKDVQGTAVEEANSTTKKFLFFIEHIYAFTLFFAKISILSFHWRMFRVTNIKIAIQILIACSVIWILARIFLTTFHCIPVQAFWDFSIKNPKCAIESSKFFFGTVLTHAIIDIAILVLPIVQIQKLQLPMMQKLFPKMAERLTAMASIPEASITSGPFEDPFSEPRTPSSASSPAPSNLSIQLSQPRPADDWNIFPWHSFPNLTISERRGRPKSWIWQHGYDLQEVKDQSRYRWVCYECARKKDPKITAHLASATTNIEAHLGNQHHIYGGKSQLRQAKKRTIEQMFSQKTSETAVADNQFINHLKKRFTKDAFQRKLVRWIVTNQPFRVAESESLRDIFNYLNPIISATDAHLSYDSIRRRITDEYYFFRSHIIKTLQQSPSHVHIAFDGWTSRNRHPLFGIVAFFLDHEFRPQKIVLGLPNLTDRHTGENIAEGVQNILEAFDLGRDKIGYFTLDNASSNETAMEHLAQRFQWDSSRARRIRCFGHVVHLVARAMLFGKDDASGVLEDDIDAEAYDVWLKRGPIGKLHNTMVWINRSNRVTEMLREAQRQDTEKSWPGSLDVVVDNNTRWLSQFYMMSRALKLRPYIDTVVADVRHEASKPKRKGGRQRPLPRCLDDESLLTEEDWKTIGFYHDLLRHFETCVKKLEGDGKQRIRKGGKEAAYGLVQDICPAYEWLMGHLEEAKSRADRTLEPAQFRTNINFAWVKLNKYYSAIDQSRVYYAATVLHPAIRWDFLHRAYRERPDWVGKAQQLIDGLWQEYKQLPVQFERGNYGQLRPIKRAKEVEDSFSSYLDSFKSTTTARLEGNEGDELDRWLQLAGPVEKDCDPFLYWFNKRFEYPRLTRMAIDILSVPPMAAECERVFSSCGNMVSAKRCRLQAETVAVTQTVRSWLKAGLLDDYDGLLKDVVAEE